MKKLMIIAALAATFAANAATTEEWEAKRLAEAREYVSDTSISDIGYYPFNGTTNPAFCAKLDAILKDRPPLWTLFFCRGGSANAKLFPLTFAAAKTAWADKKPMAVKFAEIEGGNTRAYQSLSPAERVALLVEKPFVSRNYKFTQKALGDNLGKLIVPAFRRQGKAVTTGPDGRSPVKEYADRISAVLNAPRFAGLNEILADLGVNATLDLSYLPTDAKIAKLREDILAGEKPLDKRNEALLSLCLGTAAYNDFVAEYNGGTR